MNSECRQFSVQKTVSYSWMTGQKRAVKLRLRKVW